MVFPILFADNIVQIGELIRFDASETKGDIKAASLSINGSVKEFSESDISSGKLFVDWIFQTAGDKEIILTVTDVDDNESTVTMSVEVMGSAEEKLFNSDADLIAYESKIRSWIPDGRSTWNFVHREVKKIIFEELKSKYSQKIDDANILDTLQFREWAKFKALEMIFRGINNSESDVFSSKAEFYRKEAMNFRTLAFNTLEVDLNKDGAIEEKESRATAITIGVYR